MTYQVISERKRPTEFDRFVLYRIANMPVFHPLVGFNSRTPRGIFAKTLKTFMNPRLAPIDIVSI
jgi:hypothetical protein